MLDVIAFFLVATVLALVAGAVVLWDFRRRLRRRFERSTERALNDLAADTCDDLARGGSETRSRAVRRYESVRDEVARAHRVRDLGRVAAKAEAHRWTGRAEAGFRQVRSRMTMAKPGVSVEPHPPSEDREPRSTRR